MKIDFSLGAACPASSAFYRLAVLIRQPAHVPLLLQPPSVICTHPSPTPTPCPLNPPGLLKDACGIPFSLIVQPLAPPPDPLPLHAAAGPAPLALLARCRHCYAYVNAHCAITNSGFRCSLCGKATDFGSQAALRQRYLNQAMARELLPELACPVYEVDCGGADEAALAAGGAGGGGPGEQGAPAYIALVDAASDEDFLELVSLRIEIAAG
jgi:hypothetical protein